MLLIINSKYNFIYLNFILETQEGYVSPECNLINLAEHVYSFLIIFLDYFIVVLNLKAVHFPWCPLHVNKYVLAVSSLLIENCY